MIAGNLQCGKELIVTFFVFPVDHILFLLLFTTCLSRSKYPWITFLKQSHGHNESPYRSSTLGHKTPRGECHVAAMSLFYKLIWLRISFGICSFPGLWGWSRVERTVSVVNELHFEQRWFHQSGAKVCGRNYKVSRLLSFFFPSGRVFVKALLSTFINYLLRWWIGESLMTSLFTFLLISIRLTL